jgi:iron complex transport system ATP-binding protein
MQSDEGGLESRDVWYAYDSADVLKGVSFRLDRGEMVAVAGPNGSGKTTLLSVLSGVRAPKQGGVSLQGAPLARLPARQRARRISVVSQHVDPRLSFTARQVVAMGRTPYTNLWAGIHTQDNSAIDQAMDATQTRSLGNRTFAELSGGEQQRVILAMALAQESDYLLLDEPTVHLDLHHQRELLETLRRLRCERNLGVMAVMHDLNLAALYFDRLVVLDHGRIVMNGPPEDIVGEPEFVRVFRGPFSVVSHPQTGIPQILLQREK